MDIGQFLIYATNTLGAGALVFALIQLWEKWNGKPLDGKLKFHVALVLAFLVPLAAYGIEIGLGLQSFDWVTLIAEFGVGYGVSQLIHEDAPDDAISGIKAPPARGA